MGAARISREQSEKAAHGNGDDASEKETEMKPLRTFSLAAVTKWVSACQCAMNTAPPLPANGSARILIVDDNTVMRYGVTQLIGQESGLEVVGEAVNGQEAVELSTTLRPDIVIMDVNMPLMDGIRATFLITEHRPETLVIGFSASCEHDVRSRMLEAGAVDLIDKGDSVKTLVPLLHRLWAGRCSQARQAKDCLSMRLKCGVEFPAGILPLTFGGAFA